MKDNPRDLINQEVMKISGFHRAIFLCHVTGTGE